MSISPRRFVALLSASLVLVLAVVSAGCEEEIVDPEPAVGTIQGQVTADGEAVLGVTVTLSGPGSATTTTGTDGRYSFSEVEVGVSVVTISGFPADVTFPSTSQTVAVSQDGEVVEANFAGSRIRTGSISGTVTLDGAAAANVTLQLDGDRTNTTDAQGVYAFTGLDPGQHVVAITPPGDAECTPTQHTVDVAAGAHETADFSCVTSGGAGGQVPAPDAIGALDVGVTGEKLTDSCPTGALADSVDDPGPVPVISEDRGGTPYVIVRLDADLEGAYDSQTGDWVGIGNAFSSDSASRVRETADGSWGFDGAGDIEFQGVLTVEFHDTNGTPDDFSDDTKDCEGTFDVTFYPVD